MNSLEDTFINIGLKEDEFLGNDKQENLKIEVEPPRCFAKAPEFKFFKQLWVIFKRKAFVLFRSARSIVLLLLPIVIFLIAVTCKNFTKSSQENYSFYVFFAIIAYTLNSAFYISYPVYEKEERLKYAMDVMGIRPITYWLGTLCFDFIIVIITNGVATFSYSILANWAATIPGDYFDLRTVGDMYGLLMCFGFGVVTYSYLWSFVFDKALSAVKYFPVLFFFVLYIGSQLLIYLTLAGVAGSQGQNLNNLSSSGMLKFVTYLAYIISPVQIFNNGTTVGQSSVPSFIDSYSGYILVQLGIGTFYFLMVFIIDSRKNSFKKDQAYNIAPEADWGPIDYNEINAESSRTLNSQTDTIKVMNMTKQFGFFKAVKGITFGVEPGQIFGLLGPNGAGKSTTFNILTALIPKTSGNVTLNGKEVNRNMPSLFQNVGICPQFNCLWEGLTVREHLYLFAGLKGLTNEETEEAITYFYDVLGLKEHRNKRSMHLSGGNKRKLCVANCLIGSSGLLFFDEPSTGLDPLARRFLWNALQQTLKTRRASIVLTTHSMGEAEALSHKIGILINGKFFCIGPTEYLKSKYGTGYKMTLLLNEGSASVEGLIKSLFPNSKKLIDGAVAQETFEVSADGFKFSDAFHKLGELKEKGTIKDFSLYNTTLEQVFIYFSKFQYALPQNTGTTQ